MSESQYIPDRLVIKNLGNTSEKLAIPPDAIPQERITGDLLRGRGPRRGNLERLLRYWRPIMKKPGGFRRCRVILADHPELYPLNNICAWLHHETTGLWPNEGCHHPGMKNCRKKLSGVVKGSIWNDQEFDDRIKKITSRAGRKSAIASGQSIMNDEPFTPVVTNEDWDHAFKVLEQFISMEQDFSSWVANDENWEIEEFDA
jgi:hypothetical protein